MKLHVASHIPRDRRTRRFVAQELLDGARNQCGIFDQFGTLLWMFAQHLAGPTDQSRGSFIAGAREYVDEDENLLASKFTFRTSLILKLDLQQFRHEVVGRMLDAPIDVFFETYTL